MIKKETLTFLINYSLPQEVRRSFKIRYKAPFGNLTNNTAQRLKCEILSAETYRMVLRCGASK